MAKKPAAPEKMDPTLPFTEIEILGRKYKLCYTFRAMAKAEAHLREQGVQTNLLWSMPRLTFETIPVMLAAGLSTYHPELTFEKVVDLLDYDTVFDVRDTLVGAWIAAMPKRDAKAQPANPPHPVVSETASTTGSS
jgi:hypothetical protein